MNELGRTGQVVALGLFAFGSKSTVHFRTPSRISEKCLEGLNDLEACGYIICKRSKRDGWEYKGTEKLGNVRRKFKAIDENNSDEMFPIVNQE